MTQTVTIEIADGMVLRLLHDLAAMSLIRFASEADAEDTITTARLNEVYTHEDSSLDPCFMAAQSEALGREDW